MYVKEFFKAKVLIDEESKDLDKFYLVDFKHTGQRVKVQAESLKIRQ